MNAPEVLTADPRRALIDELLHRMTVAQTIDVRMQLCAEAKRELDKIIPTHGGESE